MELLQRAKWVELIPIQASSSDGVTGAGYSINGFNRVAIRFDSGVFTTGDSDDTVTCAIDYTQIATLDTNAAASDWTTITAATQTLGPSADSDTQMTGEFLDISLPKHGISTGMIRAVMTDSLGGVSQVHCTAILYAPTGRTPDSSDSGTYTDPASS
jgi:hypothetical protein